MGKLLPSYKKMLIDNIKNSIATDSNVLYAFATRNVPFANGTPDPVFLSVERSQATPQYQMIFGKKIVSSDIAPVIKKITWVTGTIYDRYDDADVDLYTKQYYVMIEPETEGGYRHIFKCIKNGNGAPSTNKPDLLQTTPFDKPDGYRWKYMYSLSQSDYDKFSSSIYIPVTANNDITVSALESSGIDDLIIEESGINYITSHNGLVASISNTTCIQIESSASPDDGFYSKSSIYLYTPTTQSAQLKEITSYIANSTGKWVITDSPANTSLILPGLTQYKISPTVKITGDGTNTAYAYSVISNNVISEIKLVDRGAEYTHASVEILANTAYGNSAFVRAVIPPLGGHGSNVESELNVQGYSVNIKFANSESNTIPTQKSYSTVGLLRNPKSSANVLANYTSNTFSQILKATVSPPTVFSNNEIIVGQTSKAEGIVFSSNSSVLWLTGDKTFANNEVVVGKTSNNYATITINTKGDIYAKKMDIIYIHNIPTIERTPTQNETFKFILSL